MSRMAPVAILWLVGGPLRGVAAQGLGFIDVTATHLPPGVAGRCMDSAVGDVDGDGDPDIAMAMEFERNMLLLNDGRGRFSNASGQLPAGAHDSEEAEFADIDADGDLDLVFVSEDDEIDELYLNDGDGRFVEANDRIPVGGVSNALAVVDLDGDGSLDLLIGNTGADHALLNDGQGRFGDRSATYWQNDARTQDLELADVDGDGDLDVVVANEGQNQLFVNDGSGHLTEATRDRLPTRLDESREIRAVDVDADGDLDLVVANVQFIFSWPRQDRLLLNDGSGHFSDAPAGRLPATERDHFTIQVSDLDGDGDADIIAPRSYVGGGAPGDYLVMLNDGGGAFSAAAGDTVLPETAVGNGFDVAVADLDGDERSDLFLCQRSASRAPGAAARSGGQARLLLRADRPAAAVR